MKRAFALPALAALIAALAFSSPASASGFKARGFALPDGAVKIDEDRYRLPQAWDEALRFFKSVYPLAKYPRHNLRSQSPVRAVHIANTVPGEWEGVNLYEAGRGEVRVYILARESADGDAPARGAEKKQK